jgi:two-component system response regulator HupR/HoxA
MLARAIHYCSRRADKAFVVEHCGALPDQLLEAELFGYKRGAFTGAYEDRSGRFQQADGGTIFLDEIGDTSPVFQVKLLRVLQEGEFRPLGAARPQSVDVRVVAATHHDLEAEVRAGSFREDLYYRLATVTLRVPPLRERAMDIPLLAGRLLDASQKFLGKSVAGFSTEALACLAAYPWPGNVRELQNEILRMLALADTPQLGADLLAPRILRTPAVEPAGRRAARADSHVAGGLKERMEALEARVLKETLIRHRWNKSRAASELGLSRVGLRSKLVRYGLERG